MVQRTTRETSKWRIRLPVVAVGGAFGGVDPTAWLAFNEEARLDDDQPDGGRDPISLLEFQNRTNQAIDGTQVFVIDPKRETRFLVENQVRLDLVIQQVLYDGAVFSGLDASKSPRRSSHRSASMRRCRP